MITFHPTDEMNFNDAMNTLMEIAQHQSCNQCIMEFAGVVISVIVPPRHIAPRVSDFHTLRYFSNEELMTEIHRRILASETIGPDSEY